MSRKSKSNKSKSRSQMFGFMKTFFVGAFGAVGGYMAMMTVISLSLYSELVVDIICKIQ